MRAMVLEATGQPLRLTERPAPTPEPRQVLIRVLACGVCRTDLHVVDGELPDPKLPIIPGHEVVGVVEALGTEVRELAVGQRVGVPWLGWTCGECDDCRAGRENLCDFARFTGYQLDGGYAEKMVADARYCFPLPETLDPAAAAPLMCAGLIGYRTLRMAGDPRRVGIYGFGGAAHLVTQAAVFEGREVYAFTRSGDESSQRFARSLGAKWAGSSDALPPEPLDAALIFAPVGPLVPQALQVVRKGGIVVCGGIHMSDIPTFPYRWLWGERGIRSVANLTRQDGREFLDLAGRAAIRSTTTTFPLSQANEALAALREGKLDGAAVLVPG
ncbi:zinc-dependent alcohol dehydrogenase family protein [Planctomyces sp. SH-PL14]|uniref:zinc-dependent alcohol dehydrogenase family protein n=1 Tax=Planctomyces sp. SH-PL14 TaxID=1632864 RepID=UPI00078D1D7E|nr:zinc-dependent alcohol dehydrogenase family protein [Planctomyces sp. SH-PL14]AMV20353.1 Alcohol dehydrogenase [Planctomyces sp. SH-PL14]